MARFNVINPVYGVIGSIFFSLILFALPVIILLVGYTLYGIGSLLIGAIIFFFASIHHFFIKKIEVNSKGVTYSTLFKKVEMTWNEIGLIGIGYVPIRGPGKKPWIYFSADPVAISALTPHMINERFFMMNYRENVIAEIKKYWHKEIVGLTN